VARHRNNRWLLDASLGQELSDLDGRLVPVQERHVAVHQNEFVSAVVPIVVLYASDDLVIGLVAVESG